MTKVYLVTFNPARGGRDAVTQFLDEQSDILDWHIAMLNSVFVVTDLDAGALRDLLRSGPAARFIVVEVDPAGFNSSVSGLLPRATWDFIKRRQPAE